MIFRGQIYWANFRERNSEGSEFKGRRPVLVVQNDAGNATSSTTIVCLLSSKADPTFRLHVRVPGSLIHQKQDTFVCTEQLRTISINRLKNHIGTLNQKIMQEVDKALKISLGIF